MLVSRTLVAGAALFGALILPTQLAAQAVQGLGDDATVIERGSVRFGIGGAWSTARDRFDERGTLTPLGAGFSVDSLGTTQLPMLTSVQSSLRTLTGRGDLNVSLGRTQLSNSARTTVVPITIEAGLTRRLTMQVTVPIVKTRTNIWLSANPNGDEGNLAFNPALQSAAVMTANTQFVTQLQNAATALRNYCQGSGASDPQCTEALPFANTALSFGNGLSDVYLQSLFVPVTGSDVQTTVDTRATSFKDQLNTYAGSIGSIPAISADGVTGAPAAMGPGNIQQLLTDAPYGILAAPFETVERMTAGDIELAAKFSIHDPFAKTPFMTQYPTGVQTRLAAGVALRIPTGRADWPHNLLDFSTGTQQWGAGVRGYGDLLIGRHFWVSTVAKYDISMADTRLMRVTESIDQIAAAYRTTTVDRKLGNVMELEITPRWVMNELMSVGMQYRFRHKGKDTYTGTVFEAGPDSTTGNATIVIDPATLSYGTSVSEHVVGGGIAFSNMTAYRAGKAKFPIEVSYLHSRVVDGKGGNVLKQARDEIRVRVYWRVFGR